MNTEDEKIMEIYRNAFNAHGQSYKSLLWGRPERQYVTYGALMREVSFKNKTLLDVGCGFGDLLDVLIKTGDEPDIYVGIDPCEEFIEKCEERFSGQPDNSCIFLPDSYKDFFNKTYPMNRYDWIVAIGVTATIPTVTTGLELDVKKLIRLMWKQSCEGIAFTCLSTIDYKGKLNSHNPSTILETVFPLTPYVSFFHDYGEQEFMIIARRNPANRMEGNKNDVAL